MEPFIHIWRNVTNARKAKVDFQLGTHYPEARCPNCRKLHTTAEIIMPPGVNMALFKDLQERGAWRSYQKYVVELEPVLEAMSARGMPVSPAAHAALTAQLRELYGAAEGAMQALVPDECKPFVPGNGYKKLPKDFSAEGPLLPKASGSPKPEFANNAGSDSPASTSNLKASVGVGGLDALGVGGPSIEGPSFLLRKFPDGEERWVRLKKWKPSHAGLIRYMRHRGHAVPRDWKSSKETTNEDELKRLAKRTKDILYETVLEYRQIGTVLNNHLANWLPAADGRVHPTFYYETGTGQLASRRPNAQNAPRHGEGGKGQRAAQFRAMVEARPGHTLLEFDYRSFHAQTLAFEAEDADYLRLAKLDIHSYLTAHLVRHPDRDRMLSWDDQELGACLAQIKREHTFIRDYKAKRAVLGYGFGMGWRKLYMLNQESFDSQADAKRVVDTLNGLFPKACAWRDSIRHQAHEQGYLMSRFGCIRWFWEVLRWDGTGWRSGGDDSEAAVAFLPANDAFCHIKEAMLRLNGADFLSKYALINQIHDALMFECPDALVHEALLVVKSAMERPSEVLVNSIAPAGLSVEVSASRGVTWDKMEKV